MNHLNELYILLSSLSGASCNSVGVRIGSSIRKIFDLSFDWTNDDTFSEFHSHQ
jgi:hypothetical protein